MCFLCVCLCLLCMSVFNVAHSLFFSIFPLLCPMRLSPWPAAKFWSHISYIVLPMEAKGPTLPGNSAEHFPLFLVLLIPSNSHMPTWSQLVLCLLVSEPFSRIWKTHTKIVPQWWKFDKSYRLDLLAESLQYLVVKMKTPEDFSNCSMSIILFS